VLIRQTILWTGLLTVIPLMAYPRTLGLGQFGFHPAFGLLEWALYYGVFRMLLPALTSGQRLLAAGFTVVYRLVCATLFAMLASVNQHAGWLDTMAIGMWSYPFAMLPQIIGAPLVLLSVWKHVFAERPAAPVRTAPHRRVHVSKPPARQRPLPTAVGALHAAPRSAGSSGSFRAKQEERSFDDAVSYVGEYTGVRMCWLVDMDGLPLAFWQKQDYTGTVEFWAPISIDIIDYHRNRLANGGDARPERVEVRFDAGRVILEAAGEFWLGVLTERDTDELVNVRLSQAHDMVLKYLQERRATYADLQEAHYV
jgi:hypothetical protein